MPFMALQGVRVIDAATDIAGSFCAKLLADYGAEVIKVEQPGKGDPSRHQGPFPDGTPHIEKSGLFLHLNTNKKGVTLDLDNPSGQALFKRLVQESDILIESHRPGRLDSLGLGYDALKLLRPGLVMTSVTPFGQTGPHKDYEFTELTIFAMGGAMHREGHPDREPLMYGGEISQYFAGTSAATATMAACLGASLSGRGQWIDISIQECFAGHPHQAGRRAPFAYDGETEFRRMPHTPSPTARESYAVGTFKCKDGYCSFLPLGPRMWPNFTRMIGKPELVEDPRFGTSEGRIKHSDELGALFQTWLDSRTREEVFVAVQQEGIPGGPVLLIDEILSDEHLKARGFFVDIDHPDAGTLAYPGVPFGLSNTPQEDFKPAPRLGQHNDEVFGGMLYIGNDEMVELRQKGVI